jgi:Protein of unknown function (DUF3800)
MSAIFYIDESGDLGWNFTAPAGNGGSSRHLTISALCTPSAKKHIPKRFIKDLYSHFSWTHDEEKKWNEMNQTERQGFAKAVPALCAKHPDIHLRSITVRKVNVEAHIRNDPNKLYNYMIRLLLLECMAVEDHVTLVPDPRSIKVKSGNSLHDYLQTELWFTKKAKTILETRPQDSQFCMGIQFADMLAWLIQQRWETGFIENIGCCAANLKMKSLFFN